MPKKTAATKTTRRTSKESPEQRGLHHGYRSGLEDKVAAELRSLGVEVKYESHRLGFTPPLKRRTYTPDFVLPNGIIIETKGRFMTDDRQKHKLIKQEHPYLDIRFVFSNANQRITKTSSTTYSAWCERYEFRWAHKSVPPEWVKEPYEPIRAMAIRSATVAIKETT